MKNLITQLLMALALLALPMVVQAQFTFTTNSGAITITGYNTAAGLDVVIPAMTNGYPVTSIGVYAFYNDENITNVIIPYGVTNIGAYAFYECFSLISVNIPTNVTSIGDYAFFACTSLTNVDIPASVTSIGDQEFEECIGLTNIYVDPANVDYSSLDGVLFDAAQATLIQYPAGRGGSYTIPNSVTTVGDNAFNNAKTLTSVNIPDGVTSIGDYAFFACTSLPNVDIPASVTSIGDGAFYSCSSLTGIYVDPANMDYSSLDGVLFDEVQATLIQYPGGLAGSYVIPAGVTTIGANAFQGDTSLTGVTMPDGVTSIENSAFSGCYNMTSVNIPAGITNIGEYAFVYCLDLTTVTNPASVTSIGDYAFGYCSSLTSAYFLGNAPPDDGTVFYSDPATVYYLPGTTGWSSTFGGVPTELVVPFTYTTNNGTITITGYTGDGGNVVIPPEINGDPVSSIGDSAFINNSTITGLTIPNTVTSIGVEAFDNCSGLTTLIIPASVTTIGDYAFYNDASLVSVYFLGSEPPDDGTVFFLDSATVYYLTGTGAWSVTFGSDPTELWNPQASAPGFTGGQFGFSLTGTAYTTIVVEACTNLANPVWLPVSTNTFDGDGSSTFSDPQSGNYPVRFYRFSTP